MKKVTSSTFTFANLINDGCVYVDKTCDIKRLLDQGRNKYFFARPRRFGKSLLLSTLRAIFEGKKDLFKGTYIYSSDYTWETRPVINISLADCSSKSKDELTEYLLSQVNVCSKLNAIALKELTLGARFGELIEKLSAHSGGKGVAILVDEYDMPILGNVFEPQMDEILPVLKGFYSVIKKCDEHVYFAFVTGVSKFSHVSIFSGLNILTDISMNSKFATLAGYTQDEMKANFTEHLIPIAEKYGMEFDALLAKMKLWYNGFRFIHNQETVYSPSSIALFINNDGAFENYWFKTATPTFLFKVMQMRNFFASADVEKYILGRQSLDACDVLSIDSLSLMYQTGYLTIDSCLNPEDDAAEYEYLMRYPNYEIERSFYQHLMAHLSTLNSQMNMRLARSLHTAVSTGDAEGFVKLLGDWFAHIAYPDKKRDEACYRMAIQGLCGFIGVRNEAEVRTHSGRIDLMVGQGDWIYIVEFKVNRTADEALSQIKEKNYAQKYLHLGKKIVLLGININSDTGKIDLPAIEYI